MLTYNPRHARAIHDTLRPVASMDALNSRQELSCIEESY
jgi:hypothetical protein